MENEYEGLKKISAEKWMEDFCKSTGLTKVNRMDNLNLKKTKKTMFLCGVNYYE